MSLEINSAMPDLHDSEIVKIQDATIALDEFGRDHNWRVDLEGFRLRIIDTFEKAGFRVDVRVWEAKINGVDGYHFEVQLEERLKGEFDPDRQVHEQVHDVAGLGESGWIKSDKEGIARLQNGRKHSRHGHTH